jgi:hypothetical protein
MFLTHKKFSKDALNKITSVILRAVAESRGRMDSATSLRYAQNDAGEGI